MELTKIVSTYSQNTEEITAQIQKLTTGNCIDVFIDYMDKAIRSDKGSVSEYEKGYMKKLDYCINRFAKAVVREELEGLTRDELFDKVVHMQLEGTYSFDSMYENGDIHEFLTGSPLNSEKMLTLIKHFMITCLREYNDELEKSKREKEREVVEHRIEDYNRSIRYYVEQIEKLKASLGE